MTRAWLIERLADLVAGLLALGVICVAAITITVALAAVFWIAARFIPATPIEQANDNDV